MKDDAIISEIQANKQKILEYLAAYGGSAGNTTIRRDLQLENDPYQLARLELLEEGLVERGGGKGGATRLSERYYDSYHSNELRVQESPANELETQHDHLDISRIEIKNFKAIKNITIPLSSLTYLVGGNNAGKSSVLQAIHTAFSCIRASSSQNDLQSKFTLNESDLLFRVTESFASLGNSGEYSSQAKGSKGEVRFSFHASDGTEQSITATMYKALNFGNVSIKVDCKDKILLVRFYFEESLFSVYVPGLAGIALREEPTTYPIILRKAAGGEANMVFRNVIQLLREREKIRQLEELMEIVLGESVRFEIPFDPQADIEIKIYLTKTDNLGTSRTHAIDLWGTSILQIIQIFSYSLLFQPELLLLDEPDSHIHADKQKSLQLALRKLTKLISCKIIISTHSRHMLSNLTDEDAVIWLQNGKIVDLPDRNMLPVLVDLGALDRFTDELRYIFVTEDSDTKMLERAINEILSPQEFLLLTTKGVKNIEHIAKLWDLIDGLLNRTPNVEFIIHRDRDFLTEDELIEWKKRFINSDIPGTKLKFFVPDLCDIEAYHCTPEHISSCTDLTFEEAKKLRNELIRENRKELRKKYINKRRTTIRDYSLYPDGGTPNIQEEWPEEHEPQNTQIYGKDLLSSLVKKLGDQVSTSVSQELAKLIKDLLK